MPFQADDKLRTAAEVADFLAVSKRWVQDQTRYGSFPHVRLGHFVRYSLPDVLSWIEEQKCPAKLLNYARR